MVKGDSKNPEFWMGQYRDHLRKAKEEMGRGERERAAFWMHQSAECGLKAALVSASGKRSKLGTGHDLGSYFQEVMDDFPDARDTLRKYESLMDKIDPLYIESRYPTGEKDLPAAEEIKEWMGQLEQLLKEIDKLVAKESG